MYIDSHCHLDFPQLNERLPEILERMAVNRVTRALCVSVNLPDWGRLIELVERTPQLWASVGVHPDYEDTPEPSVCDLVERAAHPKVVAIGETGLDYFRIEGDVSWQQDRFRTHIRAARETGLPLIVHTREAREDTLRILREEHAAEVGGVLHCFTENLAMAEAAIELGFYISFSGIVTFKNARELQEVASRIPLERVLIETDSPYLAPVPHRGKVNDPSYVIHVAEKIAELRGMSPAEVGEASTRNFYRLFRRASDVSVVGDA